MNENILELLKNQLTGPVLGQIAQSLGLSEDKARSGVQGAIATVLAGLLQKASRPGGAEGLLKTIKDGGFSGDMLSNLGSVLGTPDGTQGLMKSGNSLLEGLLGDKLGSVANALSSSLGLPKGAVNSLLALAAPLVMSQIGKLASARGLNPAGLAELLMSQKSHLLSAAPPGLSSALGLSSLADIGKDAQHKAAAYGSAAARAGEAAVETGVSWAKWALPACLLAALLAAVGFFALRPQEAVEQAVPPGDPRGTHREHRDRPPRGRRRRREGQRNDRRRRRGDQSCGHERPPGDRRCRREGQRNDRRRCRGDQDRSRQRQAGDRRRCRGGKANRRQGRRRHEGRGRRHQGEAGRHHAPGRRQARPARELRPRSLRHVPRKPGAQLAAELRARILPVRPRDDPSIGRRTRTPWTSWRESSRPSRT